MHACGPRVTHASLWHDCSAETDVVVRKGTNKGVDSYSGFGDAFGGRWEKTELADVLRAAGVTHVVCGGLATDFCVSFTAKDAVKNGMGLAPTAATIAQR